MKNEANLKVEIDGPGVRPETLDPLATLDLGRSYLQLLLKIAEDLNVSLKFTGLRVEDKCAALVFTPANLQLAESVSVQAAKLVAGEILIPQRLEAATFAFRCAVRALPKEQSVAILVGTQRLPIIPRDQVVSAPRRSVTTLRSTLMAVGGISQPMARFLSKSEERSFSLRVEDIPAAKKLAEHIYSEMDIVAEVERDDGGLIVRGQLQEFRPVPQTDAMEAWKKWYGQAAADWDDVEDIESELERNESEELGLDG